MKSDKELQQEIFKQFVDEHNELQFQTNNQLHQLINLKSGEYASIAILYTIKWLKDEEALKEGIKIPEELVFKLKDGVYIQESDDIDKI